VGRFGQVGGQPPFFAPTSERHFHDQKSLEARAGMSLEGEVELEDGPRGSLWVAAAQADRVDDHDHDHDATLK
jgi:hypothetical protein